MKKLLISLILLFTTYYSNSQWVKDSTLANTGANSSISAASYNVASGSGNTNSPIIYRTTNGGSSWTSIPTNGIPNNMGIYCIYAENANTAYVGDGTGDAYVYKTTNAGVTWVSVFHTGGTQGFFNGIVFSKSNPSFGIAESDPPNGSGNNYYFQTTTNGGITWNLLNPLPPGTSGYVSSQHSPFVVMQTFLVSATIMEALLKLPQMEALHGQLLTLAEAVS